MIMKRIVALCMLIALACMLVALLSDEAAAETATNDKKMASKTGFNDSLASDSTDGKQKPGKTKMILGVSSVFVAIAVVKFA